MKILILNPILYTADNNVVPEVKSIKDTMIYNMCLGFRQLGNDVTLAATADYQPTQQEVYKCGVEKKKQFIVVSQLVARKNIDGIIRIFKRFVEKYDAAYKLLIVGRGVLEEQLKSLTHQLGLDGKVEFLGFKSHEEMNDYLPYSQAMLINTRQDNNMVSIPESIVSGTPVVTNTVPTNSSMVAKHRLGIVKDGWDEDTLWKLIQISPPRTPELPTVQGDAVESASSVITCRTISKIQCA